MPEIDLENMEIQELRDLALKVEAVLSRKVEEKQSSFLADVRRQALDLGLDFDEMVGTGGGRKRTPAKPKYQNPRNPAETWTGRGRAPLWAKPYKDEGKLDEIKIED